MIKKQIIEVIQKIFSQGTFVVETFNEGLLVELMELNNTPITNIEANGRKDFNHIESEANESYISIEDFEKYAEKRISETYDFGTNRICENCKFVKQYFDGNSITTECELLLMEIDEDFGCNKWELKNT